MTTTTLEKTVYTAHATVIGGREGHGVTSDGRLDVQLSTPGGNGTGTNPEQLFAIGYAACFQGAMAGVARTMKLDISGNVIESSVDLGPTAAGGFGIAVTLNVSVPTLEQAQAQELVEAAHQVCPYSNATRGNIDVTLNVTGK